MKYPKRHFQTAILSFCILISCSTIALSEDQQTNISEEYTALFSEIDRLVQNDNGLFWDISLGGPILLVNPGTRQIIANQNTKSNFLEQKGGIFTGVLPDEMNVANTAVDWDGERWTMLMLPLPKDQKSRNNLIIHESFHRIQPLIGFGNHREYPNAHLDSYEGRLLLRLELNALSQAIQSQDEAQMLTHLKNAISFRKLRQASDEIVMAENSLELNEGLAEYTGLMLSDRTDEEIITQITYRIERFSKNKTFVRSFAYQTIPIYGYLISKTNPGWHREIDRETNLINFFEAALSLNITDPESLESLTSIHEYDYSNISAEEKTREDARLLAIANYKRMFLEDPSLKIGFEKMNISFNPNNVTPLEGIGTVYPTLRITDNWGVLTVGNGALLSSDWSHVRVTEPKSITPELVEGDGWRLELNEGWKIVEDGSNYSLQK